LDFCIVNREEIEAYVNEGVITHTGLAFSRDTDKKVYIQHKMNEDAELLATMLEDGVVRFIFSPNSSPPPLCNMPGFLTDTVLNE
jgi:hypothetical protein